MTARLDRPGLLFALIGLAGLALPLVQFRPNRILPGEGLALHQALPWGWALTAALAALFVAAPRLPLRARIALPLVGVLALLLALGAAADALTPEGDRMARISPSTGFWLAALALSLMLADAIARLDPPLRLRWLIGGGGFGTFVFQGLNQTAMDLVLLGALPTIALALVAGIALDLLTRASRRERTAP